MRNILLFLLIGIQFLSLNAQTALKPAKIKNSSEILHSINRLKVLGTILYIAAHPDDENTAVLSYLNKKEHLRTAYLSITHGSGGQNLLGSEKDSSLGVLRTQELLAARSMDGGEQFFTHASDFGYSKSVEETLRRWNKDKTLEEMVAIIRRYKPDVIITRFDKNQGGHGHHMASALLAQEAFAAAGDPYRYPDQLKSTPPWQPKRLLWNTWRPDFSSDKSLLTFDIGDYNTLLGRSYLEIAALSRSMHKSQGFGMAPYRGSDPEYFTHTEGDTGWGSLFDDIDISWNRVAGAKNITSHIDKIINNYDPADPAQSIPALFELKSKIKKINDPFWMKLKLNEIDQIIQSSAGLWIEAISPDYAYTPDSIIPVEFMILNRSDYPFKLHSIKTDITGIDTIFSKSLLFNKPFNYKANLKLYLKNPDLSHSLFSVDNVLHYNVQPSKFDCQILLTVNNDTLKLHTRIIHRMRDRIRGERFRPLVIAPPATLNFNSDILFFTSDTPMEINATVKAWKENYKGSVSFQVPDGWSVEPTSINLDIKNKYEEQIIAIRLTPGPSTTGSFLNLKINSEGYTTNSGNKTISYDHIPEQVIFLKQRIKLVKANLIVNPGKIGYVMGTGDKIPESLTQIGYQVDLLSDEDLDNKDLADYNAIITGTRAYNARPRLQQQKSRLMDYVKNGGTLITLHNTRFGHSSSNIGPYPFQIGRSRVSVEDAPVKILTPDHPVFQSPNKISAADFDGWIQERGLYFAGEWDTNYTPLFASHDPGESWQKGGNLYAKHGKGHYFYSGYSWFRQLPAGVPGAYRLFVNMLSIGDE